MNTENALAESIRQYNKTMAENKRQYEENMKFQKEQAKQQQKNWEKEYALSKKAASRKSSGGSSSSKGGAVYTEPYVSPINANPLSSLFEEAVNVAYNAVNNKKKK